MKPNGVVRWSDWALNGRSGVDWTIGMEKMDLDGVLK